MKVPSHPPVLMTIHDNNRITVVYPPSRYEKRIQILIDEVKHLLDNPRAQDRLVKLSSGQYDVVVTGFSLLTQKLEVEFRPL